MKSNYISRIRLLLVVIFLVSSIVVIKLYLVQIVSGEEYSQRAERQYTSSGNFSLDRGTIYFRSKDGNLISGATTRSGFIVSINPNIIENPEEVYQSLSKFIPLEKEDFIYRANKNDNYEEVARRINADTTEKISELSLEGVRIDRDKWRFYPGNSLASHILGIVAYKGDDLAGRYGIERQYENVLKKNSKGIYSNFFAEIFSNIKTFSGGEEISGDIVTSIDPTTQSFLEKEIDEITKKWNSEYSGGIIMDPTDGYVYAMASYPDFNPNSFQKEKSSKVFSNPLIEDIYEMGSIMKPITLSIGLDSGAITAETSYFDTGYLVLNNKRISNYDGRGRGRVNMQQVLSQSLNTGAAFAVSKIGKKVFTSYVKDFGLGEKTGIDLPNEAKGLIDNLNSNRDIEFATASYGQGIAMTPIATARALSVLANGGKLITPKIVRKIKYANGLSKSVGKEEEKRVISEETSDEITRMLVKVVDEALLGGTVKLPNYSIAAKTGTAQMADEGTKGYVEGKFLHSFFGYFPAYSPRFLVFLYTVHPKEVRYASQTLTMPFMNITKSLISYYEIAPDR